MRVTKKMQARFDLCESLLDSFDAGLAVCQLTRGMTESELQEYIGGWLRCLNANIEELRKK